MIDVLLDGKDLNKQGDGVWIGRCRGSSVVVIPLEDVSRGNEASQSINIHTPVTVD